MRIDPVTVYNAVLYSLLIVLGLNTLTVPADREEAGIVAPKVVFSKFVTAQGRDLYLNGVPFRSVGVNRYNILSQDNELNCANSFTEEDIDRMFSELEQLGVTSLRFWLFQRFTAGGEDLTRLNYVITLADKHRIKLIPVFENHWADCTEGDIKSADWYASGYASPYGSYQVSLKDYIGKIVPLYKDSTTILMWQIMNEANETDETTMYNFTSDLSGYLKSLDPNHMVSLGMTGTEGSDTYRNIHSLATIDILDFHDYDVHHRSLPVDLTVSFADAAALNKPLMVGEAGIEDSVVDRADIFRRKMNGFFQRGGRIYLIWSYGDSAVTNDGLNFDSSDPLAEVVKDTALQIKQ